MHTKSNVVSASCTTDMDLWDLRFKDGAIFQVLIADKRVMRTAKDGEKGTCGPCWVDIEDPAVYNVAVRFQKARGATMKAIARAVGKRKLFVGPGATC